MSSIYFLKNIKRNLYDVLNRATGNIEQEIKFITRVNIKVNIKVNKNYHWMSSQCSKNFVRIYKNFFEFY